MIKSLLLPFWLLALVMILKYYSLGQLSIAQTLLYLNIAMIVLSFSYGLKYKHYCQLANGINQLSEWVGQFVAWLTLFMVIITFLVVVLRYGFSLGWIAMQESVSYLHALVFLLGASYALKHQAHVRVDVFYQKFSATTKAWINLLGCLLFLIPVCSMTFYLSWQYVLDSWAVYEGSREAGGLAGVYLLKTSILVMASLLLLQGIAQLITDVQTIQQQGAS